MRQKVNFQYGFWCVCAFADQTKMETRVSIISPENRFLRRSSIRRSGIQATVSYAAPRKWSLLTKPHPWHTHTRSDQGTVNLTFVSQWIYSLSLSPSYSETNLRTFHSTGNTKTVFSEDESGFYGVTTLIKSMTHIVLLAAESESRQQWQYQVPRFW